ncbi:hypothetical protein MMIC_P0556 [Mariprofundus micogutta]|uniref:Tetratricopeptide repeat protein n=1 Tax=Mariprofundus micogutta TaxID=1921010 RepID=A0A1L8CL02_9PROT|nr:hypothetical protein [Mariprofundus micogutta]GAV19608.1 hypothetical protein MMIC_P0556 [Mariprofundus micogutta]
MRQRLSLSRSAAYLLSLLLIGLLCSCAGRSSHKIAEPENPYILKANNHIQNGLAAMKYERWQSAERSFKLALTSSQLSDDIHLVSHAWYNLAIVRTALKNIAGAEKAYLRVIELTDRHHDSNMHMRARLALALMQQREAKLPDSFNLQQFPASLFTAGQWPADIRLQAARLAQLMQQTSLAKQGYLTVTSETENKQNLLKMKAEAHMGLALLARSESKYGNSLAESEQTLVYCRKIGAPRLTAHALLLQGQLTIIEKAARQDRLERALSIYTALNSHAGQKQVLTALINISPPGKGSALQLRLQQLEDKLGKASEKDTNFSSAKEDH